MDTLIMQEGSDVSEIDKSVKNKWRWAWLSEIGKNGKPFSSWAKKIKQPGTCLCTVCHRKFQYGNNGKKVLARHQSEASHNAAVRALQYTCSLPGATSTTTEIHASMADRVCDVKVRICSFIAEHDLSFTVSQPLVNLMQSVVKDKSALSRLSMSNAHASYLCTHGISAYWKSELSSKLKTKMFSLNVDEATDGNMDRILNVLVRYYDEDVGKVATQHLASRKLNIADALTITNTLKDILQSYSLNWNQVVGILLDNCSVMRGKKSGVETLVRRENPSLLDVSGDTVHMVSNAAKALLNPFQGFVEQFCSDVYYDIEKSPKQKEVFSEFQSLLHLENKSLIRPISSRFLQMLDVCNRIRELMDPLTVHFYSVLSSHDQHKHRWLLNQLLDKHAVTSDEKARIICLQQQMAKSARIGSDVNKKRKTRICMLFSEFDKLTTIIDLYRGVLPTFQVFLKKLQHEKPMIHVLHAEMLLLVRELLSKFMKPETIPLSAKGLLKLNVHQRDLQYTDKRLSVGRFSFFALNKARVEKKPWVQKVYSSLREGYIKAATFLLKNLPLNNNIITSLSALTPSLILHESVQGAFNTLAKALPNAVKSEELGQLDEEVRAYQINTDLGTQAKCFEENNARIDVDWWSKIFAMKMPEGGMRFPILGKLVKALLSLFTGPLVEGSFNMMDDIIEKDRVRLNIETYEGLAILKSHMKVMGKTASKMQITPALRRFCLSSYETYQNHLKKKKVNLDKQKERKLREAVKVLSAVRIRKVKKGSTSSVCAKAPTSSTLGVKRKAAATASTPAVKGTAAATASTSSALGVKQKAAATASTPAVKGAAATVSTSSTAGVKGKAVATASFSSTPAVKGKTAATVSTSSTVGVKGKAVATASFSSTPAVKGKTAATVSTSSTVGVKGKAVATASFSSTPGVKGKTAATASTPSTSPGATPAHVASQTLKRVSGVAKLQEYGFTAKKQKK
ncbi:uncharacterized protein LOC127964065 isoform X1 [Carassius gibelio]|uniref:uncharacterized protein LOC127964065 isoform X1 n=1 Tax=Carassius gibelio TaxID=101364 RepID=UPI0022780708|nr:uncharacterized protein LOC127964065 isoform X1 [Carassius gibelio]